jgi:hypothetical protein
MITEVKAVLAADGGFSTTVDKTAGLDELGVEEGSSALGGGSFGDDLPTLEVGVDERDAPGEGGVAAGGRPERASLNFDADGFLEDGGGPSGVATEGWTTGGEVAGRLGGTV